MGTLVCVSGWLLGKRDALQTGTQAFLDAADSSLLFLSGVSVLLLRKLGGDRGAD